MDPLHLGSFLIPPRARPTLRDTELVRKARRDGLHLHGVPNAAACVNPHTLTPPRCPQNAPPGIGHDELASSLHLTRCASEFPLAPSPAPMALLCGPALPRVVFVLALSFLVASAAPADVSPASLLSLISSYFSYFSVSFLFLLCSLFSSILPTCCDGYGSTWRILGQRSCVKFGGSLEFTCFPETFVP